MSTKTSSVDEKNQSLYYQVALFESIPGLIGGFGTRYLTRETIIKRPPFKFFDLILLKQVHSDTIQFYKSFSDKIREGDALVTNSSGLLLCVQTADCLPVLIVDESRHIIAAVHCGWRGTAKRILPKVVHFLVGSLKSNIGNLRFAFGPRICSQCYEVGQDVREVFTQEKVSLSAFTPSPQTAGKWRLDLLKANLDQLKEEGVLPDQMEIIDRCTYSHPELWSYRREKDKAGRLFNFIGWSKGKKL